MTLPKKTPIGGLFAVLLFALPGQTIAGQIFYSDYDLQNVKDGIWRVDFDGSNLSQSVASDPVGVFGLDLDAANDHMYWTDSNAGTLLRSNLDGSNTITLVSGLSSPGGVALDVGNGFVYWVDALNTVRRADLDGSNVTDIFQQLGTLMRSIELDVASGHAYLTDSSFRSQRVFRINLDGSSQTTGQVNLVTSADTTLSAPDGLALDLTNGHLYWADAAFEKKIKRANLDGTDITEIVTDLPTVTGLALDSNAGEIYWGQSFSFAPGRIQKSKLDGSNITTVAEGLGAPYAIALITPAVPEPSSIVLLGIGCMALCCWRKRMAA